MSSPQKPLITGLCGSIRPGSYSLKALNLALKHVEKHGAETALYDPAVLPLPFCDGDGNKNDQGVLQFSELVKRSHGLILVTPEYHGTFSGVMKNMLDLLGFDELEGKVVGLVSVLGGSSNSNALNHLRISMRWVHSLVIPEQVAIGAAYNAFDKEGNLKDAKLAARMDKLSSSLVNYTRRLFPEFSEPIGNPMNGNESG